MALYGNLYEIFIDRETRDGLGYGTCIYSGQEYERQDFYGLFGGLFYIGIILSIVFLSAAVLIIYQSFLQSASKHALTKESELQGKKTKGGDAYVGSYTAGYDNFDGTEYIFGATGLERAAGSELTVTYTLRIASVIWNHSGSQYALARVEGQGTHELTLGSGDNYIVLKGEGFTGSLELEVKQNKNLKRPILTHRIVVWGLAVLFGSAFPSEKRVEKRINQITSSKRAR